MKLNNKTLERLSPLNRIIVAAIAAFVIIILFRNQRKPPEEMVVLAWVSFSVVFLMLSWVVIFSSSPAFINKKADKEDGSRIFVFVMIIIAAVASFIAVVLLIISGKQSNSGIRPAEFLILAVGCMLLSWAMVHTVFTFHYAYLFYKEDQRKGLDFPGDAKPDYLDFAYLSFGVGSTFQVADVAIQAKNIRRTVLFHSIISFLINTFVVALSINIIAGITQGT